MRDWHKSPLDQPILALAVALGIFATMWGLLSSGEHRALEERVEALEEASDEPIK